MSIDGVQSAQPDGTIFPLPRSNPMFDSWVERAAIVLTVGRRAPSCEIEFQPGIVCHESPGAEVSIRGEVIVLMGGNGVLDDAVAIRGSTQRTRVGNDRLASTVTTAAANVGSN